MTTLTPLSFSEYNWEIKKGSAQNVWVDVAGLHLKIIKNNDVWSDAAVSTTESLGSGTYQWHVKARHDTLDKNVALVLSSDAAIEFIASKLGADTGNNAHNIIHVPAPETMLAAFSPPVSSHHFSYTLVNDESTIRYKWTQNRITCTELNGYVAPILTRGIINQWSYAPPFPDKYVPKNEAPVNISLSMVEGAPPSDNQEVEVLIKDFSWTRA